MQKLQQPGSGDMDLMKQVTEKMRQTLAQDVGGRKFFNRLEIEQKRLQRRREEEKREAEAKALRKKQQQKKDKSRSSKLSNSKTDIQSLIKPESSSSASRTLPREEVIRRLRFLKHPVTLFGEDEDARLDRLNVVLKAGLFEVDDSDMTEGQTNDFLRDILELKKSGMLKRKATDQDTDGGEGTTEKGSMETSYNYLFEEDLPVEKGISSNILAHEDQLIVQSLTQMAMGDERPLSSERTLSRSSSPTPKSLVLTSSPRWDGTPENLNLQQNVENADDLSDDDQPLAWKVRKLVGRQHQRSSRDQVHHPTTRSSSGKLFSNALKENHQKTTQRRKLKRKMIVEDEPSIQPEKILDPEDGDKE
ncbi:Pre-mRNA-splicing factor 18 [Datura stramonium]|uniref:Pre-mRNA-splicing factor 18 n=1 Tax=Datura stramonium TaxID=4076 RepID=A0ABS8SZ61_DATST|nr:Pre-mRNA-splicing factor 18 [Datura stramonium]